MKTVDGKRFCLALPEGARIALAFSGGRDSVALADLMLAAGADFFAVHVEHGIRGENSVRDAEFAAAFCGERGIGLCTVSVDAPAYAEGGKLTLEQAARELRYSVFDGLISAGECDLVALAHHADDQTETVLMRVLRGTGIKGLRGMSERSGRYIRPLLSLPRSEIDAYIAEKRLPFVEDETNSDESYTRNFIRAELRRIKSRFPAVNEAVARLAANAAEADAFIDKLAPYPEISEGEARLPLSAFREGVLGKRAVARACAALGVVQDIEEKHFAAVLSLAGGAAGKRVELSHGIVAHRESEAVVFTRGESVAEEFEEPFPACGCGEICGVKLEPVDPCDMRAGDGALYADLDKIPRDAVLRRRRAGDRIVKFGGGKKSFGDYLTDKKIPLRRRPELVVCAAGSNILFAAGVDISESVRVTGKTTRAVKITLIKKP